MLKLGLVLLICNTTLFASDRLPKFLSFGYQAGISNMNIGAKNESYFPNYPTISFEGHVQKQFYFQIDFTNFIVLAGQTFVDRKLFSNSIFHNINVTDLTSAIRFFAGNIKLTRNLSVLPLGLDFNRLSYTSVSVDKILYASDIGYTNQLIYNTNNQKTYRIIYAYCVKLQINNPNSIHKIEFSSFLPNEQKQHWGWGAFIHFRSFTKDNISTEPIPGNLLGLKLYMGVNW